MNSLKEKTQINIDKLMKEDFSNRIILLTYGGSISYGTNNENSDIDLRGIVLPSKKELFSMNCPDKPYEDKENDTVIFPLKQIINLFTSCNPNVLDMLGTKDEHIFILEKTGKLLKENQDIFLCQKVFDTYGGYATAQLRRLQNALARGHYPQEEKEKHIKETLECKINSFPDRFKTIDNDIVLSLQNSNKTNFSKEICIDLNLSQYPIRDLNGFLQEMSMIIKEYDKLNHRNSKKDEVHLLKHAMHLIRLLKQGTEILEGKPIQTYRPDKDFLLKIRNGEFSYEEIFELSEQYREDMLYAKKHSPLPLQSDTTKIEELTFEILKSYY